MLRMCWYGFSNLNFKKGEKVNKLKVMYWKNKMETQIVQPSAGHILMTTTELF